MGNALAHCMLQPSIGIRVMTSDGEVLEFDNPILTKQLMRAYPGHLVVHCAPISRSQLGQRSKVSVMRPEDALVRGQTYCLVRVPIQGGGRAVTSSKPPSGVMPNRSRQQHSGEIGRTRSSNSSSSSRLTLKTLFGINDVQVSDHVLEELFLRQLQHQSALAAQQQQQQQQGPKGSWRPALDAIMESPSGSRSLQSSITMSPLARQAGYIPASQTAMRPPPKVVLDTQS